MRYENGPTAKEFPHHDYLIPTLVKVLERISPARIFEVGCGEGAGAAAIASRGYNITAVDPWEDGIATGKQLYPELKLFVGSAYDDLASRFGRFPCVISLEVVEHVYFPRDYARTIYNLLEDGGTAIISTPYHGYLKNLLIAATGKWDRHHSPLWDHGHIKFWSMATLGQLLQEAGFTDVRFYRVGRIAPLAKSMIAVARR